MVKRSSVKLKSMTSEQNQEPEMDGRRAGGAATPLSDKRLETIRTSTSATFRR
jgi:hypothetical protein